ncbi:MAG: hypothetical protein HY289_08040 [Planctomycetes bacterium]|nr:hypothetical protein [Planctomycetota bacterium]
MTTGPLLDLFYELRRRNLVLGVSEYLAALEALALGFGIGSRAELCWMCQALWSKSPEEHEQVVLAVDQTLPAAITQSELDELSRQADEELRKRAGDSEPTAAPKPDAPVEAPKQEIAEESPGQVELAPVATASADTPLLPRSAEDARRGGGAHFDLIGELPVPRRYIKRAWRYVRRMQRVGPAVELNVEATVTRRYREGVLVAPVLVPRRRNLASVLLLVDEGGSMVPFRPATAALIESARQSGFSRVDVCYFHDVVAARVYRDPGLRTAVPLDVVLRPFAGGGVLIISDAGAARRRCEEDRAEKTRQFLASMRPMAPRIAWLNPVPPSRWPATTAEFIRRSANVPMFPFERGGLDSAMDVLRGRGA